MPSNNPYITLENLRKIRNIRNSVDELIASRWSPRSYSGESIPEEHLMTILDAARTAPSAFNNQPWTIIYALRDTPEWAPLFSTLTERNQKWVKECSALFVFVSHKFTKDKKPIPTASYDTGASWMLFALQAERLGYPAHGMAGYDPEAVYQLYSIPKESFKIEAMATLGILDSPDALDPDLQSLEKAPSERKELSETAINANRAKEAFARFNT